LYGHIFISDWTSNDDKTYNVLMICLFLTFSCVERKQETANDGMAGLQLQITKGKQEIHEVTEPENMSQ